MIKKYIFWKMSEIRVKSYLRETFFLNDERKFLQFNGIGDPYKRPQLG